MPMKGKTIDVTLDGEPGAYKRITVLGETVVFVTKNSCYLVTSPNGDALDLPEGMPYTPFAGFQEFYVQSTVANDTCRLLIVDGKLGTKGPLTQQVNNVAPLADDLYSVSVGNTIKNAAPSGMAIGGGLSYDPKGFPIAALCIAGDTSATGYVQVTGVVQGNRSIVSVINTRSGKVYWNGQIPAADLVAQGCYQVNTSGLDLLELTNALINSGGGGGAVSVYPNFSNGNTAPYLPV